MCGFRQQRSDRRPQWFNVRGRKGDVRISPKAFGPQAAMLQCMGRDGGGADFAIGARTAGRNGSMYGVMHNTIMEGWR